MKKNVFFTVIVAAITLSACKNEKSEVASSGDATTTSTKKTEKKHIKLKNNIDSVSYFIGFDTGSRIKQASLDGADINTKQFIAAMKVAMEGNDAEIDMQKTGQTLQEYIQAKREKIAEEKKNAGADFLAKNAKKEGVKVTESGLQYLVEKEGEGKTPSLEDTVEVHYHGTTIDGKVFDSSVERGKPITFPLKGVIKGWQEGLQLMKVGSKYKLFVPADIAYGAQGKGGVGPNETLIFDVELLSIKEKETPKEIKK